MSVYNAESYLNACIDSVLSQSYKSFLFYIIDDASTDNSLDIIKSYDDKRIFIIQNSTNIGLTKSLNKVVELIETKYIARIDADDICLNNRFEVQLNILEKNNELALLGSSAFVINERNEEIGEINIPIINLKEELFFKNSFIHSSIMIRTEVLKKYKYDERLTFAQDYNLWVRIAQNFNIANIENKLIKYRVHNKSISVVRKREQGESVLPTIMSQFKYLGFKNESKKVKMSELHLRYFVFGNKTIKFKERIMLVLFYRKVLILNRRNSVYNNYLNSELVKIINSENRRIVYHLKKFISKPIMKIYER